MKRDLQKEATALKNLLDYLAGKKDLVGLALIGQVLANDPRLWDATDCAWTDALADAAPDVSIESIMAAMGWMS